MPSLFKLVPRNKRGLAVENFGRKAQTGHFVRDRENATDGELLYTEHMPARLPQNKDAKRNVLAIHTYLDRKQSPVFDRHPRLKTTHIRIQSPILRTELRSIIKGAYNLDFDNEDGFTIYAPFEPVFFARHDIWHRFEELEDLKASAAEDDTDLLEKYDHMKTFIDDVLNGAMGEIIEEADNLEREGKITYNLLWTLFPHESVIVAKEIVGYQQAYQVEKFEYLSMTDETRLPVMFDLTCQYVHFDAFQFGFLPKSMTIGHFVGKKDVKDLDIVPIKTVPNHEELRSQLVERGKKLLQYQDVKHVQIKPIQLDSSRQNFDELLKDLGRSDDHGRAIVDFYTGVRRNVGWRRSVKPLQASRPTTDAHADPDIAEGQTSNAMSSNDFERAVSASLAGASGSSADRRVTREELEARERPDEAIKKANAKLVEANDLHSLLMCPLLHAFSLQNKKWITINVDSVAPVTFRSQAFDHLVADEKYKSHLLSLVKSQLHSANAIIPGDPIPEKGRGLLVLLSGPPGTGKTLMAESIAEKSERPLYYVDARDLGTGIVEITKNFSIIMENAREWNAVVLLDEADIYLQTRLTAADANSSDRTTAFLKQLEYFQGILFLTTNVPQTIDPAIESRIHINLRFPVLSAPYRISIWQHFLANVPKDLQSMNADDFSELGRWKINGRQIKNAFRMCVAYCLQERLKISLVSIEDMIGMSCPEAEKESFASSRGFNDNLIQMEDELVFRSDSGTSQVSSPFNDQEADSFPSLIDSPDGDSADVEIIEDLAVYTPTKPSRTAKKRPTPPAKSSKMVTSLSVASVALSD